MRNKFLAGCITGILCTLFVGSILFIYFLGNPNSLPWSFTKENETGQLSTESELAFQDKKQLLFQMIQQYYYKEVKEQDLYEGMYKGMLAGIGDPYAAYYTEEEFELVKSASKGIYMGVGATVMQDPQTKKTYIVSMNEGGPAEEAGILPGDIIRLVDGVDVSGKTTSEIVALIKGREGTEVVLSLERVGVVELVELTVTRREIITQTVEYEMLEDQIGYLLVTNFDEVTIEQFEKALKALTKEGMQGLVIDLRNNPGGLYDSVVAMLDQILPKGLLVYTEDKYGNRVEKFAETSNELTVPLAVLINGQSASASEIFAGAVQDYKKGTIVGTQSYGKGIVQSVFPLKTDESAVKITVSSYFTPKGRSIHGTGITPDVEEKLSEEAEKWLEEERETRAPKEKDNQLQKAVEVVKGK